MQHVKASTTSKSIIKILIYRSLATIPPCIVIIFRRVRKIAKCDYYLRHVRPSVYMEQLGSQ